MSPSHLVCSIAVITRGKYSVLEAGAMTPLISLLNDPTSEVRTNAVKVNYYLHYSPDANAPVVYVQTLTMLAETPKGKQELQSILPQVTFTDMYLCTL